jgi:putative phage-type endonuclease
MANVDKNSGHTYPYPSTLLNRHPTDTDFFSDHSSDNGSENTEKGVPIYEQWSEREIADAEQWMMELLGDYFQEHLASMSSPDFHTEVVEHISLFVYEEWLETGLCEEKDYRDVLEWVDHMVQLYYVDASIPPRSFQSTEDIHTYLFSPKSIQTIRQQIDHLKHVPQPTQKTPEWYANRYNMLTASNVWKALGSETQFNSLVYEKCTPFNPEEYKWKSIISNPTSTNPMHWGIKYEPLSRMIYEMRNRTTVEDFGCIPHPEYPFIGASPDGIVVDENSPLFGRMIEIKNIVNRTITGIPLEAYWIQMQLQMEVCDLDECDFIETRFAEFDTDLEFYEYVDTNIANTGGEQYKGVILFMIPRPDEKQIPDPLATPKYVYMPLNLPTNRSAVEHWIETQRKEHATYVVYYTMYWKLLEYSCITVLRNTHWFRAVLPKIEHCWRTIEKERVEGYAHRASQSRKKTAPSTVIEPNENTGFVGEGVNETHAPTDTHYIRNLPQSRPMCLIKLD